VTVQELTGKQLVAALLDLMGRRVTVSIGFVTAAVPTVSLRGTVTSAPSQPQGRAPLEPDGSGEHLCLVIGTADDPYAISIAIDPDRIVKAARTEELFSIVTGDGAQIAIGTDEWEAGECP
jgi:hypothetical protein